MVFETGHCSSFEM